MSDLAATCDRIEAGLAALADIREFGSRETEVWCENSLLALVELGELQLRPPTSGDRFERLAAAVRLAAAASRKLDRRDERQEQ